MIVTSFSTLRHFSNLDVKKETKVAEDCAMEEVEVFALPTKSISCKNDATNCCFEVVRLGLEGRMSTKQT